MENFNLTPSPALLDLLGKIPFKGWQCVAELIDNSIDAIINNRNTLQDYQKVIAVSIPTKSKILNNEPLIIEDWGVGMNELQLENAVKAGFSSKNTNSNLGLFGMGFNVATSRLANTVQIWTSTLEMAEEIGVCIDLREMKKSGSFFRPKVTRLKRPDKKSGTRVEIFDYKPDSYNLLKPQDIYRELNRAYSERIFNDLGIKIYVNEQELKPFTFCVWDASRTVKHKYDDIPAVIEIDEYINEEMFCENCFFWLGETFETSLSIECPHCHSQGSITKKTIYVKGWVGIQRYSDSDHYGIDISRNGRILSKLDKSFFSWENEKGKDDSRFNPEYPRDTTYAGGRIVGQIEANFVIPKYTKDDFERDDKNWRKVVNFLRGEMPLQPDLANSFGFKQPNKSPIGLLFNAYRKINTPGSKTLVFARENGSADHITSKTWAQKFYEGDPDYLSDIKWWEAVLKADLKDNPSTFNPLNPLKPNKVTGPEQVKIKSPNEDKFPGKKLFKKTMYFDIEKILGEGPISLTLIEYYPDIEINRPVIFENDGQKKFKVYLNNYHPIFRDFADGYEDLIYMEVANMFAALKNDSEWTVSRIYYELKSKYAQETMLSVPKLVSKANDLMRVIQNKLVFGEGFIIKRNPSLDIQDVKLLKQKYLDLEGKNLTEINDFVRDTRYLKYLDLNYLFRFIEEFPEMIFDGKIFNLPYSEIDEPELMQRELKKYLNYFQDVRWFMNDLQQEGDEAIKKRKSLILRNRLSLEILDGSICK